MTWVVPLALGGIAILVMAVFTMVSSRSRHRTSVVPAQIVGPRVLVHDINDDRCTGCDACVAVCPTNVLDLVANKSRVLRFEDCIQCEACMFACPTEALVMFPEGSTPPPLKVPEIDENFQTVIPGQYLIGEVAGKPLVKNAANLGRAVVEHMLTTGLYPGALGPSTPGSEVVDVVIVGSGPGGLSAALSCIQKRLSYVVLEKEQEIASTISRYPKGKLVMAEPYDTANLSLLPVFDSSKEQLIPIWRELLERVRLRVNLGESVESIQKSADGAFEVRTTVSSYRAQRVVLSIGTRGKPRTLQVPGENLPKVYNLLDDPDAWAGRDVLVVGGGDSACEAALALADAGARVIISYRGKGFNRAAPKNKQTIERYAAEGRIKARLASQVLNFDPASVTIALGDGTQKRYPNDAAFVLIGAEPPVAWLEKVGIHFVERPHQFQLGKSDDIVRRFVARAIDCPEDAGRAAAQVLGGSVGVEPSRAAAAMSMPMPPGGADAVRGPKKWLRSATSIFTTRSSSVVEPLPTRMSTSSGFSAPELQPATRNKKLDAPMPLSEFALQSKRRQDHTGHGRRDQLTAGERTRILRMLRDEGGRLADEGDDEQVHIGVVPRGPRPSDYDFSDQVAPPPPMPAFAPPPTPFAPPRPEVEAKPALVVGIAQARSKRQTAAPPPPHARGNPHGASPPAAGPPGRPRPASTAPPPGRFPVPNVGPPPTPPGGRLPAAPPPGQRPPNPFDDKTRAVRMDELDARISAGVVRTAPDDATVMSDLANLPPRPARRDHARVPHEVVTPPDQPPAFLDSATVLSSGPNDEDQDKTRLASVDQIMSRPGSPARPPPGSRNVSAHEERTRIVDVRGEAGMNDVDWDID